MRREDSRVGVRAEQGRVVGGDPRQTVVGGPSNYTWVPNPKFEKWEQGEPSDHVKKEAHADANRKGGGVWLVVGLAVVGFIMYKMVK